MEKAFLDSSSSDLGKSTPHALENPQISNFHTFLPLKSEDAGEGEGDELYMRYENDLTQLQEDVIYAIESLNKALFIDLGGCGSINLEFEVNK